MITAAEIRKKTERKYADYLRSVVAGSEFEPIVIPCDKKASASMAEYQRELTDLTVKEISERAGVAPLKV